MTREELVWSDPRPPNADCFYDHVDGVGGHYRYRIEWKSWKKYPGFTVEVANRDGLGADFVTTEDTLEAAKAAAQAHYAARILSALEPLPCPHPSAYDRGECCGGSCFVTTDVRPLVFSEFRDGGCVGRPHPFQYFITQNHDGQFLCHHDESVHDSLLKAQEHAQSHYRTAALRGEKEPK